MFDQLKIGNGTAFKLSYEDFDASLAEIHIKAPEKKEVKETVPFSNQTYDFSKINGDLYWNERELNCLFEIIADSPEELERKKTAFSNWIMNVFNEEIHSPFDPEYHYVGTYYDMEYADEDCVEKTTATVTFKVFPYKVANDLTNYVIEVNPPETRHVVVRNDSGHRIIPTVTADLSEVTIKKAGEDFLFPIGESINSLFTLEVGDNSLEVTSPLQDLPLVGEMIPASSIYDNPNVANFGKGFVTSGFITLYAKCTANGSDATDFTLSEPYSPAYWQSLDAVAFAEKIVGCWYETDDYYAYRVSGVVSNDQISAEQYWPRIYRKPCTVKVTFYREVF